MDDDEAWRRLREATHGVLSTVHAERGVDAIPVVYAVTGEDLAIPVDRVKAKRSTELQRIRNIRQDPRCVLLVHRYDDDWRRLWWVRVHAEADVLEGDATRVARRALEARYDAYRQPDTIAAVLRLRPTRVRGWRAT